MDLSPRRVAPPPGAKVPDMQQIYQGSEPIELTEAGKRVVRKELGEYAATDLGETIGDAWMSFIRRRKPGRIATAVGVQLASWFSSADPELSMRRQLTALASYKMWQDHGQITWYPSWSRPEERPYIEAARRDLAVITPPAMTDGQRAGLKASLHAPLVLDMVDRLAR